MVFTQLCKKGSPQYALGSSQWALGNYLYAFIINHSTKRTTTVVQNTRIVL